MQGRLSKMIANIIAIFFFVNFISVLVASTQSDIKINVKGGTILYDMKSEDDKDLVIGMDFGTESVRVGLYQRSTGKLSSSVSSSYSTNFPKPGWAEQEPSDWWRCAGEACRKLMKENDVSEINIKAIAVDTTACSVVALDEVFM